MMNSDKLRELAERLENLAGHLREMEPDVSVYRDSDNVEAAADFLRQCAEQRPVAHMRPSDLERFKSVACTAVAYSVVVEDPDEHSIPLYAFPQPAPVPQPEPSAAQIEAAAYERAAQECEGGRYALAALRLSDRALRTEVKR